MAEKTHDRSKPADLSDADLERARGGAASRPTAGTRKPAEPDPKARPFVVDGPYT